MKKRKIRQLVILDFTIESARKRGDFELLVKLEELFQGLLLTCGPFGFERNVVFDLALSSLRREFPNAKFLVPPWMDRHDN